MPYVAANPDSIDGTASVGSGECVALVQQAAGAPVTRNWSKGALVKGNVALARGTAIATFDTQGKYLSHAHGNHAAICLGQDASGIQVVDQWNVRKNGKVTHRRPAVRTLKFNDHLGTSDNGNNSALLSSGLFACLLVYSPVLAAPLSCPTYLHGSRLAQFGIFDENPGKGYEHAPDDEAAHTSTWSVKRFPGGEPDGFHLVCTYQDSGKVDLLVPASATLCKAAGSGFIPNVACQ